MHGGELVEQLRVHQLKARLEQLSTDQQRQDAADHQHGEREQQVQRTDVLVVGGVHPAAPAGGTMVAMVVVCVVATVPVIVENCAHCEFLNTMGR
ncbi:hypothetical protein D3C72_1907310 [compost metagenome]